MKLFNNILKNKKYTCSCCGHKTLTDNAPGETCPVCCWEEEYFGLEGLFCFSESNSITLYEAQENYKKFACCCDKLIKKCRKPFPDEEKDNNWVSIQDVIENKYSSPLLILDELNKLSELLMKGYASVSYINFKCLYEIKIFSNYEKYEFSGDDQFKNELVFKSLSIALSKKDYHQLLLFFYECYRSGINYYISWSILLVVIIEMNQYQHEDLCLTEILLDIENNDFYGIKSLKSKLNDYWHSYKVGR